MSCVCIVDESNIKAFSSEGEDFIASLQFKLRSVWSTSHGLLLERATGHNEDGRLPTLFALLHPLDEITPVIIKQGIPLTIFFPLKIFFFLVINIFFYFCVRECQLYE